MQEYDVIILGTGLKVRKLICSEKYLGSCVKHMRKFTSICQFPLYVLQCLQLHGVWILSDLLLLQMSEHFHLSSDYCFD